MKRITTSKTQKIRIRAPPDTVSHISKYFLSQKANPKFKHQQFTSAKSQKGEPMDLKTNYPYISIPEVPTIKVTEIANLGRRINCLAVANYGSIFAGTGTGKCTGTGITKITGSVKVQSSRDISSITCMAINNDWIVAGDSSLNFIHIFCHRLLPPSTISIGIKPELILPGYEENLFDVFSGTGERCEIIPKPRDISNPVKARFPVKENNCITSFSVPIRAQAILYPGLYGKNVFLQLSENDCIYGLTRENSRYVVTFRGRYIIIGSKNGSINWNSWLQEIPAKEITCMALDTEKSDTTDKIVIGTADGKIFMASITTTLNCERKNTIQGISAGR